MVSIYKVFLSNKPLLIKLAFSNLNLWLATELISDASNSRFFLSLPSDLKIGRVQSF